MKKFLSFLLISSISYILIFMSCSVEKEGEEMSTKNVERARHFMKEHFRNPSIVFEMSTDNIVVHWAWGETTDGAQAIVDILSPPSDPEVLIDDCFGEDESVAMHMRVKFAVAGRDVWRDELLIFRFEGELISEVWAYWDRQYESEQRSASSS